MKRAAMPSVAFRQSPGGWAAVLLATAVLGCMSQYNVIPKANGSPVNIGTRAQDAWFRGA